MKIRLELYRRLLRLRMVEETIAREYAKQEMRCPVHLSLGQEGIAAGASLALHDGDALFCTHRSHGAYICVGGGLRAFFAELYGKATGCTRGRGGSMHLVARKHGFWAGIPIVGSSIPIATGVAFGFQMQKLPQAAVVLVGEGATEEGIFHESVQFASLKQLPVVYLCENNGLAVNTPLRERRPDGFRIRGLAAAHGLPVDAGDGNNAEQVYRLTSAALEKARHGGGPSFLEFETYRIAEHCGPGDDHDLPFRSREELALWQERCPVKRMHDALLARGLTEGELEELRAGEAAGIAAALQMAQADPFPPEAEACLHVYAREETENA